MAMLENFASLEEKILCLNYPISKLDGVYIMCYQNNTYICLNKYNYIS